MRYSEVAGLKISRLGLGGNVFGVSCNAAETRSLLDRAFEFGVNFVDTADVYGKGNSESFIGSAVGRRRRDWIIATKAGVESNRHPGGTASASVLRRKLERSLRSLGTDYIDIYQLHHFDPDTDLDETVEALDSFRQEGKIRTYGLSNFSERSIRECAERAQRSGWALPATLQCHYNLLARGSEEGAFNVCADLGIGALVYGVLGRGVLSGRYTNDVPPSDSRAHESASVRGDLSSGMLEFVDRCRVVAKSHSFDLPEAMLVWSLRENIVASAIVGIRNEAQLRQLASACDRTAARSLISDLEALADAETRGAFPALGAQTIYG